jgi:tetratricopeptide (TPR) repeat protein
VWQQFVDERGQRADVALLSVAVDVEPERARPFADGWSFPTVVDSAGQLGRLFDFDVVPNGLLIDESGTLQFKHIGGFDIRRPEVASQLEALLEADFSAGEQPRLLVQEPLDLEVLRTELAQRPDDAGLHFALGDALLQAGRPSDATAAFMRAVELDPRDWSARFALGTALHQQQQTSEALVRWREALALDPANFTVRKQIWMVEHPERFYPTIDLDWQQQQLKLEGF